MLPRDGEFYLRGRAGYESRNLFEFTGCREFQVESSILFGAAPAKASPNSGDSGLRTASPIVSVPAELQAGIEVAIALAAPIDEKGAVGAPIEAEVAAEVVRDRKTLIPRGAAVHGRIRRFETVTLNKRVYFAVGLEFTEIEAGGTRIPFRADLVKLDRMRGLERALEQEERDGADPSRRGRGKGTCASGLYDDREDHDSGNSGGRVFFHARFMRGEAFQLPKGFKTIWRTRASGK